MDTEKLIESFDAELALYEDTTKSLPHLGIGDDPSAATYFGLGGFDRTAYNQASRLLNQTVSSYRASIKGALDSFATSMRGGATSIAASRGMAGELRSAMQSAFGDMFRAGGMRMGNPAFRDMANISPRLKSFITRAVSQELKYFTKVLDQTMGQLDRVPFYRGERYVKTLNHMYYNGMVGAAGPNHLFWWEMSGAVVMHCPDCLEINAGNPYTRRTLPTVPLSGDTQCSFNCQCILRTTDGEGRMGGPFPGTDLPMSAQCMVRTPDGMVAGASIQKLFDDLYRQLNLIRGKMAATTGEELKRWIGMRAHLNKNIIDLTRQYNVQVIPRWAVKDILANVKTLKGQGLSHVTGAIQLRVGGDVFLVEGGALRVGVFEGIVDGKIAVRIGGQQHLFSSMDDIVMFGTSATPWIPSASAAYAERWAANSEVSEFVYHGTGAAAGEIMAKGFSSKFIGQYTGNEGLFGKGFYFTTSKSYASGYSRGEMLRIRLNVKNPLIGHKSFHRYYHKALDEFVAKGMIKADVPHTAIVRRATELIREAGYDSVWVKVVGSLDEICVFDYKDIMVVTD